MALWIKICGLTSQAGVDAALAASVDALGFVFAPSKRRISASDAVAITTRVPAHVMRIAVMLHPEQTLVDEVAAVFRPDYLQTDFEDLAKLQVPRELRILPVFRSSVALPGIVPELLLFEGAHSGSGKLADWSTAATLTNRTQLILAGGLTADNVGSAVSLVRPFGIDVSSGVERAPGVKDPEMIRKFVEAARTAATLTCDQLAGS